jgi:hypothetical protein
MTLSMIREAEPRPAADHSRTQRAAVTERTANCDDKLADAKSGGIPKRRGEKVTRLASQHGKIRVTIGANDLGIDLVAGRELDGRMPRSVHHVS